MAFTCVNVSTIQIILSVSLCEVKANSPTSPEKSPMLQLHTCAALWGPSAVQNRFAVYFLLEQTAKQCVDWERLKTSTQKIFHCWSRLRWKTSFFIALRDEDLLEFRVFKNKAQTRSIQIQTLQYVSQRKSSETKQKSIMTIRSVFIHLCVQKLLQQKAVALTSRKVIQTSGRNVSHKEMNNNATANQ